MTFIHTVPEDKAVGKLRELYNIDIEADGHVANLTKAFSLRPEVLVAWRQLAILVRGNMNTRRYELVTIAVAATLRCKYDTLVHGASLRAKYFAPHQVEEIVSDWRGNADRAGLTDSDVAMMSFVEKMTLRSHAMTQEDVDDLRMHGFNDMDIIDIVLAAAARNFFGKALNALGVEPDPELLSDTGLLQALDSRAEAG